MSSNIKIKKICEHCGSVFIARTTGTRYCTHRCNQKAYKANLRKKKIGNSMAETQLKMDQLVGPGEKIAGKELLSVKELSIITTLSESTIFRLVRDTDFPRLRVGHRLLFNKTEVVDHLKTKYSKL